MPGVSIVAAQGEVRAVLVERQRAIELNQRILDTAPLGIIAVDREGRITMMNEAFAHIAQVAPEASVTWMSPLSSPRA